MGEGGTPPETRNGRRCCGNLVYATIITAVGTPSSFLKATPHRTTALEFQPRIRYGLEYPVAQDNDFDTWDSYNNRYLGGAYDETENQIRNLLEEIGHDGGDTHIDITPS